MILLREARESDVDSLLRFAQIPGMFNLPSDRDALVERIRRSKESFSRKPDDLSFAKYAFVAEDLESNRIVATSMIAAQHGTPEAPHFYFQVGNERRFSETINTGFIHGTLTLGYDTDGPSELGALVVDPEYRNHPARIGRQISFVRFLYLAGHRDRFRERVIAELLPPLNKRGLSPLWEAVGRRFTSMDYWEADQLAAKNKDFIFDLFPTGKIYTTFLPAEARNAIGKVGKDTEPVLHMLKKIGFEYKNQVDPFDGGPHLWSETGSIKPVKNAQPLKWESSSSSLAGDERWVPGLITRYTDRAENHSSSEEFKALSIEACIQGESFTLKPSTDSAQADAETLREQLGANPGDTFLFTPYY
jgi:arginine N-succinyltransferase